MANGPVGKIYISCRHGDDAAVAGRLRDCFEDEFGGTAGFLDAQDLPTGADFIPSVIEARVVECDVVLALISQKWLDAPDGAGMRLIDSPDDIVHIEIASALRQGTRVIPILVNDAQMPGAANLPEPLKPLAYCVPVQLSHGRAIVGLEQLVTALRHALAEAAASREAGWAAAGAVRGARASGEDTDTAHLEQAGDWPTLAELHEAIEPAEWEVVANWQEIGKLPAHSGGVSGSRRRRKAGGGVEVLSSSVPTAQREIESWRVFLDEFPDDIDAEEARARLLALERVAKDAVRAPEATELAETTAWARATNSGSIDEIRAFLNAWPTGQYAREAKEWLNALEQAVKAAWSAEAKKVNERSAWQRAARSGNIAEIKAYLNEWPLGEHAAAARARLETLENDARTAWEAKARKLNETKAWEAAWRSGGIAEIEAFLQEWPAGEFAEEARARIEELRGPLITRRGVLLALSAGTAAAVAAGGIVYAVITPREAPLPVLSDSPIRTFAGHTAWIHSLAFSPDGRTILSAGGDNILKLWDAAGGKEIQSFASFPDGIRSAALSPNARTILCGGNGGTLILVGAGTGKILRTFKGHGDGIPAVAFSPDGRQALSASWDKTLKLWDVAKGRELRTFSGHRGEVNAAGFSPDGKTILSGSRDKTLRIWDTVTGRVLRTFAGHTDWISAAVFSPDGRTVLSSSTDNTLRLWDVATGKELRSFPSQGRDFSPVTFSPDGRTILSGGYRALKLWDAGSGRELGTFTGHAGGVTAVAFSPDGRTAVSGGMNKMLKLWDMTLNLPLSAWH